MNSVLQMRILRLRISSWIEQNSNSKSHSSILLMTHSSVYFPNELWPQISLPGSDDQSWLKTSIYPEGEEVLRLLQALRLQSPNSASPESALAKAQSSPASLNQKSPPIPNSSPPPLPQVPCPSYSNSNTQAIPRWSSSALSYSQVVYCSSAINAIFLFAFCFLFLFCFYSSLLILTVSSNCLPCGMKISQAYVNSLSLWNSWLSLESP
jgi:hypothetical protein